jgi:hypothetical protein
MSDNKEKLNELGAQRISEDTHIPIGHIQAILHENFEGLTRLQFLGFISILERDFKVDLSDLRARGLTYFDEHTEQEPLSAESVLVTQPKVRNYTPFYIIIVLIIFIIALYYTIKMPDNTNKTAQIDNSKIEKVVADIDKPTLKMVDINQSIEDKNITQVKKKPIVKKELVVANSLTILPRSKVWLGYIDVATNKKYQKTFSTSLNLDPTKKWLLMFGHGYINIKINGVTRKFSDKNRLRLLYKDATLKKITANEFKKLNRGRKW